MVESKILSNAEVQELFHKVFDGYQKRAEKFMQIHGQSKTQEHENNKLKNVLIYMFYLEDAYGIDISNDLKKIVTLKPDELKNFMYFLKQKADKYNKKEKELIREGISIRAKEKPFYPEMLKEEVLYLKIEKIESVFSLLNKFCAELNAVFPIEYKIKLIQKNKNNQKIYRIESAKTKNEQSLGKFLSDKINQLKNILNFISLENNQLWKEFINEIAKNSALNSVETNDGVYKTINWVKEFKKTHKIKEKIFIDDETFFILKELNLSILKKDEIVEKLKEKIDAYEHLFKMYNFDQTKENKIDQIQDDSSIDLIIFSKLPNHLVRMSAYTDWESCMTPDGGYSEYVANDIGEGTIVVYGVNSNNPTKKIVRTLLKPYKGDKGGIIYHVGKLYGQKNAEFYEIVNAFVQQNFNKQQNDLLYMFNENLYADGAPKIIPFVQDVENLCKYLKVKYHKNKKGIIIEKSIEVNSTYTDIDFSNTIIQGMFTVEGPRMIEKMPQKANNFILKQVLLNKEYDLSKLGNVSLLNSIIFDAEKIKFPEEFYINNSIINTKGNKLKKTVKVIAISNSSLEKTTDIELNVKDLRIKKTQAESLKTLNATLCDHIILESITFPNAEKFNFKNSKWATILHCSFGKIREFIMPEEGIKIINCKFNKVEGLDFRNTQEEIAISYSKLDGVKNYLTNLMTKKIEIVLSTIGAKQVNLNANELSIMNVKFTKTKDIEIKADQAEITRVDFNEIRTKLTSKNIKINKCIFETTSSLEIESEKNIELYNSEFRTSQTLKMQAKNIDIYTTTLKNNVELKYFDRLKIFMGKIENNLDLSCGDKVEIIKTTFSNLEKVLGSKKELNIEDSKMNNIEELDLSYTDKIDMKDTILIDVNRIKGPKKSIVFENVGIYNTACLDLSACDVVKMHNTNLRGVKTIILKNKNSLKNKTEIEKQGVEIVYKQRERKLIRKIFNIQREKE